MGPIAKAVTARGDDWRERILTNLYVMGQNDAWDQQLLEKNHQRSPCLRDFSIFAIALESTAARGTWAGRHVRAWWGTAP